jgi:glycosyltransferase involved in cell wall biosynthesis
MNGIVAKPQSSADRTVAPNRKANAVSSIDVMVPCYDYGRFLRECVESILSQSGVDIRVLIIDDASPDNTAEIGEQLAQEDARVSFYRHSGNKGHIATFNEGIEWASADYFLLISADDFLFPGALGRAVGLMNRHPEVGFTFGKVVDFILTDGGYVSQPQTFVNKVITQITDNLESRTLSGIEFLKLIDASRSINIVRTPTAVVRTELQKRAGGYLSELPHSADMEMWLRLSAHASVGILNEYQAASRYHGGNMQFNYYKAKGLADLEQRKEAFECFFKAYSHTLPEAQQLHGRLLSHLGLQAVGQASHAFSDKEVALSEQLAEFALSIYPEVKKSLPWAIFTCKRLIGVELSSCLAPVIRRIRQVVPALLKRDS